MMLRAQVRNGRLELSEPTELPEGQIVELMPVEEAFPEDADDEDDFDEEELAALHAALDRGRADGLAGRTVPAEVVLAKLRERSARDHR